MEFTGERYITNLDSPESSYEHWHRYLYVTKLVKDKSVLDIASGEGYGSYLLSKHARKVVGVDISQDAIDHAARKYIKSNLDFKVGSADNIPIDEEAVFDVVVSFETIEHISEEIQKCFLQKIKKLLKPGGLFIISTPNKLIYSDIPKYKNEFHIKEFYLQEFKEFLGHYFKHLRLMGQKIYPVSYIWDPDVQETKLNEYGLEYSDEGFHPTENRTKKILYAIAICSDDEIMDPAASVLVDLSEKIFKVKDNFIAELANHAGKREEHITTQENAIRQRDEQITTLGNAIKQKDQQLSETVTLINIAENVLKQKDKHIASIESSLLQKDQNISDLNNSVKQQDQHISHLEQRVREKEDAINHIHNSHGWKILLAYYTFRDKFLPLDSKRRHIFKKVLKAFTKTPRTKKITKAPSFKRLNFPTFSNPEVSAITPVRINFPTFSNPEVSIIIPVWNKWDFTYSCLNSILENTKHVAYEVIIVDNASTDKTPHMLNKINTIKKIRNKTNLGFVEACNKGARAAKGKYVLFLNNDTNVTKDWLKSMYDLAEREEKIGAVGAKLIYPDGRLQEAGGIIWNDKVNMAWNYGKFNDPDHYEFNYVREVDYCSAACLMVRRNLFEKIGGFDSRYAPAYCEDTDLAFSIRKLGYKVVYQPKAEIIHFEGITAGTDTSQGIKQYQVVNQDKFYSKWKPVLEQEHSKNGETVFLARDRSRNKRVMLFIDHYVPTHDKDAGSVRMFEYLHIFIGMGFKIIFWPDNLYKMDPYTTELQQMGVEVVYGTNNFKTYIEQNGKYIDVAYLVRPHITINYIYDVKKHSDALVFYDGQDLHFLREQRRAKTENNPELLKLAEDWKEKEFYIMENADVNVVLSDYEKEIIEKENPDINVIVMPYIQHVQKTEKNYKNKKDMLFIGGFAHIPNEDAVMWFAEKIFPFIKKEIPSARFIVLGSNPTERVSKLNSRSIVITGFQKDINPFFQDAKIFVAPLRYGAGLKGKIVQAMSYQLPVVTTAIGAEGMRLEDMENVLIADKPEEFARKVVELYTNEKLWNKLQNNCIKYINNHCSTAVAKDRFERIFRENKKL